MPDKEPSEKGCNIELQQFNIDLKPSAINMEFNDLNLESAKRIVDQRVIPNAGFVNNEFFKYRKAKYQSRLNTTETSNNQQRDQRKPSSVQTQFRSSNHIRVHSQSVGYTDNNIIRKQKKNEIRYQKMLKELEEEMAKIGIDTESENDLSPPHTFKPIGHGREKVPLKKEALRKVAKKPNKNPGKQVRNKSNLRK
mmetsp:Transcript_7966/g.7522  ORF Transcript_7966/g.7522 Transcript_7966/m.7522 type:complete len:195 (+) Transcript_7966:724-1308(+)